MATCVEFVEASGDLVSWLNLWTNTFARAPIFSATRRAACIPNAVAQSDQTGLSEHIRELQDALAQPPAVEENGLLSALQTNRPGQLTEELRQRLLAELGFNWQSSEDYVVVSKATVRDIQIEVIKDGKLTNNSGTAPRCAGFIAKIIIPPTKQKTRTILGADQPASS